MLTAGALAGTCFLEARSDPVVRRLHLRAADAAQVPVRILLMSEIHSQPSDMSPARLGRIVAQANELHPDLIVLAGDFLGDDGLGKSYSVGAALAPLGKLRPRYGTIAVLGNHDRKEQAALRRSLGAIGVNLVEDGAVRIGPVSVGGLARRFKRTTGDLLRLPAPRILVAHMPEKFGRLPRGIDLMLAGHTHCGQIALPFYGPIVTGGDIPYAHACGIAKEGRKVLVVTAGLGTSKVPLRFAAPPDMWLITLERP